MNLTVHDPQHTLPPPGGRAIRSIAFLWLFAALLLGSACDKIPLLAPNLATISVSAPVRVLALGASTEVTAVVQGTSGQPVQNGTLVHFTTSLGRVDPADVETRNGSATTTFFAGDLSGSADVRASSGAAGGIAGAAANTNASNVISFTIGAAATTTVTIRANPASVSVSGGTVDVIATVFAEKSRVLSGVTVTFSANHGTLSSSSATSDANGEALVRLTTNVDTNVTANVGSVTSPVATVSVLGTPAVTLLCQGLVTTAAASTCTQTTGLQVTFTASRSTPSPTTTAIANATLDFGDGSSTSLGTLSSPTTVTHTYNTAGNYSGTLRASDVNGQSTSASVAVSVTAPAPKPPLAVNLTASVGTGGTTGQRVEFTAAVTGDTTVQVESYAWDFGDGTTAETSGTVTSHVYSRIVGTAVKTYTATVKVKAVDGRTANGRAEFQINLP